MNGFESFGEAETKPSGDISGLEKNDLYKDSSRPKDIELPQSASEMMNEIPAYSDSERISSENVLPENSNLSSNEFDLNTKNVIQQNQGDISNNGDVKTSETSDAEDTQLKELTEEEKTKIKEETGWSDEIIDNVENMKQYEILKNAGLIEAEINEKKCLIRENIDPGYTDEDGISNEDRMKRGLSPYDSESNQKIELHHLGQKEDSPLVELTEEEHRTGDYENGKKNQSLWHDNTKDTEVHGEGSSWNDEKGRYWKTRIKNIEV